MAKQGLRDNSLYLPSVAASVVSAVSVGAGPRYSRISCLINLINLLLLNILLPFIVNLKRHDNETFVLNFETSYLKNSHSLTHYSLLHINNAGSHKTMTPRCKRCEEQRLVPACNNFDSAKKQYRDFKLSDINITGSRYLTL
jgi:hypothetical protein